MPPIAIVLKGYPRLSETFIAQEILALQRRGFDLRLVSLRHPTDTAVHPVHREITAPVTYLPEYLYQEPARVLAAWRAVRRWPTYGAARALWWADLKRDATPNRVRRFGQALVMAHELAADTGWIYAHFMHTPSSVARYAAVLRGLPFSMSAHAKDIYTSPDWELREKLAACAWTVTCTAANVAHLRALASDDDRVDLVYHGLDFSRFPPPESPRPDRDGTDPADPVVILSVGRLVAKKGYPDLIDALAALPRDRHWRLVHIGGGGLKADLAKRAQAAGIGERIDWQGARPQEWVIDQYRKADLFVLASRIADDGDRDGLPNVLMEAQSQALPCVATRVSAIPELIVDEETGLLVPPDDPPALAAALGRMVADPALRRRLGAAGSDRVRSQFGFQNGIDVLAKKFPGTV
ncbi:MAG: glycosyltransferase [Rhodobacterales bacterium]|nr:glycosyltransferase [Rhodobacterales bacterium]